MWIFIAEALFAVGLLLFIVWWTFGSAQRRDREELARLAQERTHQSTKRSPPGPPDA